MVMTERNGASARRVAEIDTCGYRLGRATPRSPRFAPPRRGLPRWRPRSSSEAGRYHSVSTRFGQRPFEIVLMGLLGVIAAGFVAGLFVSHVSWPDALGGLVPRFEGPGTVLLAASMLGATVMPHAVYVLSLIHISEPTRPY